MTKTACCSLTLLLICSCFVSVLSEPAVADWPTYRGNSHRSGATRETAPLPLSPQWIFRPVRPPRPAWPAPAEELPRAHSDNAHHVAVARGTAYFGSSVDDKVYAIDVADGKIRWSFFTEGPVRFAPAFYKGRVYFGSDDGYVYCLDADSGRLVWKYRPGPDAGKVIGNGRMISTWPVRTSVLVDDDQVLATAGVFPFEGIYICALKAEDGSVIWRNDTIGARAHELDFGGISPQGYLVASKSTLYVPSGRAMPAAFDRETGRFRFYARAPGKRGGTWALLDSDRLIAGVDASGIPAKMAYDAGTGTFQQGALAWAARAIDMVVTRETCHVLTPDGIQTIDRKLYSDAQNTIRSANAELKRIGTDLSAALKAKGCPPAVPMPDVHLSDLRPVKATCGWGRATPNRSIMDQVLTIAGKQYEKGMGVHPYSELVYGLKAHYRAFVAVVGVDDAAKDRGTVVFQVFIDGKNVCDTPILSGAGGHWNIYVPIPAASRSIRLVVTDAWDGTGYDQADWVNAGFVTRNTTAAGPAANKRPDPTAKTSSLRRINALRDQRDRTAAMLQQAMSVKSVRSYRRRGLGNIIRAGKIIFAGGKGLVLAVDARTDKELWKANVEGRAVGLAVADNHLFVSTDTGLIYCFAGKAATAAKEIVPGVERTHRPKDEATSTYESAAERIVEDTGITKGYCLVRDCGTGRMAIELAKRTDLKIIALEKDPRKLAIARTNIEAAGLLGARVAVQPWSPADLPDYFANLIVSDEMLLSRKARDFSREWARLLTPGGGTAVFCSRKDDAIVLEKIVRKKLKGAGSWTSLYANAQNTACSEDRLAKGPFGVLWYGDPGPKPMVERHARAAAPVSMNGRLFIQGGEVIMAYDAYNGAFLWKRDLPGAVRVRVDVDGGNLALTEDALYVAAGDKCHRLDPATGRTLRTYTMPRAPDGRPRRWGHVACAGNILLGTTAKPLAREYGYIWKRFIDTEKHEWRDKEQAPPDRGKVLRRGGFKAFKATYPTPDVHSRMALQRGGGLWRPMAKFPSWGKEASPKGALTDSLMSADALFALNADTGRMLWCHRGKDIPNISVTVADGVVYFVESAATAEQRTAAFKDKRRLIKNGAYEQADTQVDPAEADVRLVVAVRQNDGKVLWRKPVDVTGCGGDKMGAATSDGVLLLFGHFSNHDTGLFLNGRIRWRRITALSTRSGEVMWSRPLNYLRRPLIVGDTIIIEPRACDLRTGKIKTRPHPVSGQPVPWEFLRPGHSCGITSASADTLFYRSFCGAIYEMTRDSGLNLFGAVRPGCWISMIAANGLMLMPEASSGCTCSYPLRCSVALVPKPARRVDDGSVFITHGPMTPAKQLAVNLGATGDWRDKQGKLWLAYPRPKAVSGVGYGPYGLKLTLNEKIPAGMGFFCREFRQRPAAGSPRPWLFSSGCTGPLRCELPLIDDSLGERPARYTLRLGFAAPADDKPGQRVFDIKVQGRTVVKGFDIVREAGAPDTAVVRQFDGVNVKNVLALELVPRTANPAESRPPVINFIEAVREDPIPAQAGSAAPIPERRAAKMLATADAKLKKKDFDGALDLYHSVFDAAEAVDARLRALDRMTALARPKSLGGIRRCWDGALSPILSGYKRHDPKILNGMVKLRLAVADKLAVTDKARAAGILREAQSLLPRLTDPQLGRRLISRAGYILDWRLLGPVPWGGGRGTIKEVLDAGRPLSPDKPHKIGDRLLKWRPHAAGAKHVDLLSAVGSREHVSAYAYGEITLDKPRDLLLKIGGDDAFKCWFNGKPAGGPEGLTLSPRHWAILKVKGRKGLNTIMLQVVNTGGAWHFSVQVTDTNGAPAVWPGKPAANTKIQAAGASAGLPFAAPALLVLSLAAALLHRLWWPGRPAKYS